MRRGKDRRGEMRVFRHKIKYLYLNWNNIFFFFYHSRMFLWPLGVRVCPTNGQNSSRERLQREGIEQYLAYGIQSKFMQQESNRARPVSLSRESHLCLEYRGFCETGVKEKREKDEMQTERKRTEWLRCVVLVVQLLNHV